MEAQDFFIVIYNNDFPYLELNLLENCIFNILPCLKSFIWSHTVVEDKVKSTFISIFIIHKTWKVQKGLILLYKNVQLFLIRQLQNTSLAFSFKNCISKTRLS